MGTPSTWRKYKTGMCDGCFAGCCTLPVEVSAYDLIRLGLTTEDEAGASLKKTAKRLQRDGVVKQFFASTQVFILEQTAHGDCLFLGADRRCTVYVKRPEVCRQFPKIGPRPGYCPNGASEYRPKGASERRPNGASEYRPKGASERRPNGASEYRPKRTSRPPV